MWGALTLLLPSYLLLCKGMEGGCPNFCCNLHSVFSQQSRDEVAATAFPCSFICGGRWVLPPLLHPQRHVWPQWRGIWAVCIPPEDVGDFGTLLCFAKASLGFFALTATALLTSLNFSPGFLHHLVSLFCLSNLILLAFHSKLIQASSSFS